MRFLFSLDFKFARLLVAKAMSLILLPSLVFTVGCTSRPVPESAPALTAQKKDVSDLVPADLGFAKEFVQFLVASGWTVQPVRPSKLNGFFRETKKAAWIDTDKGILEVVFFTRFVKSHNSRVPWMSPVAIVALRGSTEVAVIQRVSLISTAFSFV